MNKKDENYSWQYRQHATKIDKVSKYKEKNDTSTKEGG